MSSHTLVLLAAALVAACGNSSPRTDFNPAFSECAVRGLYDQLSSHNETVTTSLGLHAEANVETEPASGLKAVMVLQGNPVFTRVLSDLKDFPNRSEVGVMSMHILVLDPARLSTDTLPAHVFVAKSGELEIDALDIDSDVVSGTARYVNFVEVEADAPADDFAEVPHLQTTLSMFGLPTDIRLNTTAMPNACQTRVENFTFASVR